MAAACFEVQVSSSYFLREMAPRGASTNGAGQASLRTQAGRGCLDADRWGQDRSKRSRPVRNCFPLNLGISLPLSCSILHKVDYRHVTVSTSRDFGHDLELYEQHCDDQRHEVQSKPAPAVAREYSLLFVDTDNPLRECTRARLWSILAFPSQAHTASCSIL